MNVRDILARYGVKPGTLPLEGDATPLAEALEAYVEGSARLGYQAAMEADFDAALREEMERRRLATAPDLADWVAAACRSKLGAPVAAPDSAGYGFVWRHDDIDKDVELLLSDGPIAGVEATVWHGDGHEHFATPAELRAALDAIGVDR